MSLFLLFGVPPIFFFEKIYNIPGLIRTLFSVLPHLHPFCLLIFQLFSKKLGKLGSSITFKCVNSVLMFRTPSITSNVRVSFCKNKHYIFNVDCLVVVLGRRVDSYAYSTQHSEVYLELCKLSMMEIFCENC